jgi:DNA replication protein DnaC
VCRGRRRAIVESVASHEVVLLDDLGKEHASTNVESIVYELFDALHVARVTLVAATNVPATRGEAYRGPILPERYDEAVRSRLRAMCERFVVKGEDRRQTTWEW